MSQLPEENGADSPPAMATIGLIGGMSWQSTVHYYRLINEDVAARLGGLHSACIVMHSVDFADIEHLQQQGEWTRAGEVLARAAGGLAAAGADLLVLCTNTMHKVAGQITAAVDRPFLHIADATAARIRAAGIECIGLLGTRFTMEEDFYAGRLARRHGLQVITPTAEDRRIVDRVIFDELCRGDIRPHSRQAYRRIMADLVSRGAEGVIAGCTEITLLVGDDDLTVPLFDTTAIHATAAVDAALGVDAVDGCGGTGNHGQ